MSLRVDETGPKVFDAAVERFAVSIESQVFLEAFGNTRSQLDAKYEQYRSQTIFLLVTDESPVGMMRMFLPGEVPSLSLSDAESPPFGVPVAERLAELGAPLGSMLDVATIAITGPWRGGGILGALTSGMATVAERYSISHCCAIVEQHVLAYLGRNGLEYKALAEPSEYLGSWSVPAVCTVQALRGLAANVR